MNYLIFIIFFFVLNFASNSFAYTFKFQPGLIEKIQNIDLIKITEDIDILNELFTLNTIVFRGVPNQIFKDHANSIVYIQTDRGLGSGVVINEAGDVITNAHLISDSKDIYVVFKPIKGTNVPISVIHEAEVIKIDKRRDLALIRPLYPPGNINPIIIGEIINDGEDLIGTNAHCIGHPDGLTWTYTKGIISSYRLNYDWPYYTDKYLTSYNDLTDDEIDQELEKSKMHRANLLQTDCAINPGNSGGALINDAGFLIGINTFTMKGNTLINFAVAVNEIENFIVSDKFVELETVNAYLTRKNKPVFISGEDKEGDGKMEVQYWDTNGNGISDSVFIDENADDLWDIMYQDLNENGKIDARLVYLEDNTLEHYFDIDEDGVYDAVFIDKDDDGDYEIKKKL